MRLKLFIILIVFMTVMVSCSKPPIEIEEPSENLGITYKTIDLVYEVVNPVKLMEVNPDTSLVKGKSIYFGDIPKQLETTVHLFIEGSMEDLELELGNIYAFLDHDGTMYGLGMVGSYGINDVDVFLKDWTDDGIKEINIVSGMGAAYKELNVIGYDDVNKEWNNLLKMGTPNFIDLDGNGEEELVGVSAGSIPSYVDIYEWNANYFEKADLVNATDSTYANLFIEDNKWIIETGKWENNNVTEKKLYRYENQKLININN